MTVWVRDNCVTILSCALWNINGAMCVTIILLNPSFWAGAAGGACVLNPKRMDVVGVWLNELIGLCMALHCGALFMD